MLTTFVYLLIDHIFWQYEFGPKLGEGSYSYVHAGTRCKDGLKVSFFFFFYLHNFPYLFRFMNGMTSVQMLIVNCLLCCSGGCENC